MLFFCSVVFGQDAEEGAAESTARNHFLWKTKILLFRDTISRSPAHALALITQTLTARTPLIKLLYFACDFELLRETQSCLVFLCSYFHTTYLINAINPRIEPDTSTLADEFPCSSRWHTLKR